MSSQLIPPASELGYGYVVCRVIRRVADTVDDDDKPDILPASGKVIFTPAQGLARTMDYSAFLLAERLELPLDSTGHLVRRTPGEGETLEPGVWLAAGVYSVAFRLDSGEVPSFPVEVTTDHTPEAPLDLVTAAPYTPPTGVTVQTILVPAGAVPGHVLAWSSSGEWTPSPAPSATSRGSSAPSPRVPARPPAAPRPTGRPPDPPPPSRPGPRCTRPAG